MYLFKTNWEHIIKDMVAITPIGKNGTYIFGRQLHKSVPNDAFIRFVVLDGTGVITDARIIPVYL